MTHTSASGLLEYDPGNAVDWAREGTDTSPDLPRPDDLVMALYTDDARVRAPSLAQRAWRAIVGLFAHETAPVARALAFDAPIVDPVPPLTVQQELLVRAEWDVAWDALDCRAARGDVRLTLDGAPVPLPALGALLSQVCLAELDLISGDALAIPAIGAFAARLLDAPRPAPPQLAPAILALGALAPPAADPTFFPVASTLPSADARLVLARPERETAAIQSAGATEAGLAGGRAQAVLAEQARVLTPAAQVDHDGSAGHATPALVPAPASRAPATAPAPARIGARSIPAMPEAALAQEPDVASAPVPAAPLVVDAQRPPLAAPGATAPAGPSGAPLPGGPHVLPLAGPAAALAAGAAAILVAAFALYQRLARPRALDHEGRRALYDACAARNAPATAGELGALCGMERKTAEYHLTYLARLGVVLTHELPDEPRRYALPVVRRAPAGPSLDERLLATLRERPGVTAAQVADALGITRPRAERRLKELVVEGRASASRAQGQRTFEAMA